MRRGPPPGDVMRSQTFFRPSPIWRCRPATKGWKCHANTGKARSSGECEYGRGQRRFGVHLVSEQTFSGGSTITRTQDPLYLFACHLEWHHWRNLAAYQALVAALDDSEKGTREIAEMLLHRISPRPRRRARGVYSE